MPTAETVETLDVRDEDNASETPSEASSDNFRHPHDDIDSMADKEFNDWIGVHLYGSSLNGELTGGAEGFPSHENDACNTNSGLNKDEARGPEEQLSLQVQQCLEAVISDCYQTTPVATTIPFEPWAVQHSDESLRILRLPHVAINNGSNSYHELEGASMNGIDWTQLHDDETTVNRINWLFQLAGRVDTSIADGISPGASTVCSSGNQTH
eukprot:Filipodium_phascolosomae@DN6464_c0_g1_i1.p1